MAAMTDQTTITQLTAEECYAALRNVIDPEIYQNIVDLGLVYGVEVGPENTVDVIMTLTCLLYTSPSPRDRTRSRMPSSA